MRRRNRNNPTLGRIPATKAPHGWAGVNLVVFGTGSGTQVVFRETTSSAVRFVRSLRAVVPRLAHTVEVEVVTP